LTWQLLAATLPTDQADPAEPAGGPGLSGSEFAFLAFGLILGVPAGAALLVILRARPTTPREIRLTVTPDSVPRRQSATLASRGPQPADGEGARGGPADLPAPQSRLAITTSSRPPDDSIRTPVPSHEADGGAWEEPAPLQPRAFSVVRSTLALEGGPLIGFPIAGGTDPLLAALARVGAAAAVVPVALAMRGGGREQQTSARGRGLEARGAAAPEGAASSGAKTPAGAAGDQGNGDRSGPCADRRRAVDERCALASRLREQAEAAARGVRGAQRDFDDHLARADRAAATMDPRSLRTAKEAAQHAFRAARDGAGSQEGVEAAARDWLLEINRINLSAREATTAYQVERDAANGMVATLERLALEADAARIGAESAAEACVAAREALAACEEAEQDRTRARRMPPQPSRGPAERRTRVPSGAVPGSAGSGPGAAGLAVGTNGSTAAAEEESDSLAAAARGERQPAIAHLLAGDRVVLGAVVDELSSDNPDEVRRWRRALTDLVDGIVARAIEASSLDFPTDHPFWGAFTREQCRDITTALASLGFRYDGLGGFVDDRVPAQRDLSLATGYAGLDPMRVRHWPSEADMPDLFRDVSVAAFEYLVDAAGGLTLGELLTLLGRRADALIDLWNAWGRVRPLLLEPL